MKKFVGTVNGKTFNNEKDFNTAANEAIKANDGTLSISSYYSYVNEDEQEEKNIDKPAGVLEQDSHILNEDDYLLNSQKSSVYKVSDELKEKLLNASNKKELIFDLDKRIISLSNSIISKDNKVKSLDKEIERLQDKLYEKEEQLKDIIARKHYYEEVYDILHSSYEEKKPLKRELKRKKTDNEQVSDKVNSLISFMKELGFDF